MKKIIALSFLTALLVSSTHIYAGKSSPKSILSRMIKKKNPPKTHSNTPKKPDPHSNRLSGDTETCKEIYTISDLGDKGIERNKVRLKLIEAYAESARAGCAFSKLMLQEEKIS